MACVFAISVLGSMAEAQEFIVTRRQTQNGLRSDVNNRQASADSTLVGDSAATTGLQYHTDTPDSILQGRVFLFHYRSACVKIDRLRNPQLAPTGIEFNDPLDAFNGSYYLSKGVVGHPHTDIIVHPADGIGIALQPDPNIGYAKRPWNVTLYQTQSPYTVLSYNSSLKKDYVVHLGHAQNVMPGWNVAFDYRLICPEGIYTSSGAKNHYLDATTNYFSRDARLQATAGIIWQKFNIDENGGISDDSYFTQRLQSNRAGIPVNLTGAGTVNNELGAFAHGSYNMVRQFERIRHRDSLALRTEGDTTMIDTIDVTDTIRVRSPRTLNAGVVGFDLNYDRRKRVFSDSTLWREMSATLFWTNDAYPDHRWHNPLKVTLGITPRVIKAVIALDTTTLHSTLDPFGNATLALGHWQLHGSVDLRGSMNDSGLPDHRYVATLSYAFDSARSTQLSATAISQRRTPDVRYVHDALVYQNLALQPIDTRSYRLAFTHCNIVDFSLQASHMSHNTWYDTLLVVHEGVDPLWLYQASLSLHLAFGWFHLDMQHTLQHSTDSTQLPVPLLTTKNSAYADFTLFGRAIRAQLGIDLRYHSAYHAPAYDPETGLFVHQTDVLIGNYLWADAFLNINVKRASFYLKAGHVNAIWETTPNYFILPHYPGARFGLAWGITWHFFD